MSSLPDALRPWREWLSWFEPDLAIEIGALLQRLSPLLGPFRGKSLGGEPEMEGLDDLRVRGSYEHLLATEWLLAEEMPDEFLRRAASGEHIFLAPRPRARRADRSVIALFDAGPLQFGAPRLAHLAIWILLARRAQQAGGEFRWGSLQSPGELIEAHTSNHLKSLLMKRTFAAPDEVGLARWRTALDESRMGGERWLIGSALPPEFKSAPAFTHRVGLNKDLKGTTLDVSLLERGMERGVRLKLPEASRVTPLLRGVFVHESRPEFHTSDARAVALMRPPVISFDGTRVCLLLRDQPAALIFVVPRSIKDQPSAPRFQQWSRGYSALGMSFIGKQLGVLLSDEHELRFWGSSLPTIPSPLQEDFRAPGSTAAWLPLGWLRAGKAHRVCVIDQSNRLLRWDSGSLLGLQVVAIDVLGMVQINKELVVFAHQVDGEVRMVRHVLREGAQRPKRLCHAPAGAPVLFGRGRVCAVRVEDEPAETWHIDSWSNLSFGMRMQLPEGLRAVGVMREPDRRTTLISLDRNTLRLHFAGGGNEILYTAPDRLVSCTVCPNSSLVALVTERRQLIVVSAAKRELLLSVQTGRQSNAGA